MILTIKHKDTTVILEEKDGDRFASMGYNDQNKYIQETIKVIAEQIIKLQNEGNTK